MCCLGEHYSSCFTRGQRFHSGVLLQEVSWTCPPTLRYQSSRRKVQKFQVSALANVPYQLGKTILCRNLVGFFLTCTVFSYPYFFNDFHCFTTKKYVHNEFEIKDTCSSAPFKRNFSVHFLKSLKQVLKEVILVKTSKSIKLTWPRWQILKLPTFNFVQFNKQLLNIFHI